MTIKSKAERKNALAEILAPKVIAPEVKTPKLETLAEKKVINLADLKPLILAEKKTPRNLAEYKDPFASGTYYANRLVGLYKALEVKTSKKSILFTEVISRVNRGEETIKVIASTLFENAEKPSIKGSIYLDDRFPEYFLDLAELYLDYKVESRVNKSVIADRIGGGTIKDALVEFTLVKIPSTSNEVAESKIA